MSKHASLANSPKVSDWLDFAEDGELTLRTGKVDIGQRITSALVLIAAEELNLSPDRIQVTRTQTGNGPNEGYTVGSLSMQHSGYAIKKASATARHILTARAAEKFAVPTPQIEIEDGNLRAIGTNQNVTYWELLAQTPMTDDVDENAEGKDPTTYQLQGQHHIARGMIDIMTGRYEFIEDMHLPEMLHARIIRPPHYHSKLLPLDDKVRAKLGEENIHLLQDGSFLAVAARNEYIAVKAAKRVANAAEWESEKSLSESDIYHLLTTNRRESFFIDKGCIPNADMEIPPLADMNQPGHTVINATYKKPYHMHGSIGPSAGCAVYDGQELQIWTHNQGVYPLRAAISEAFGLDTEKVRVQFVPGPGVFGHNGADDAAFDAAIIAMHVKNHPILLKWTREDEHSWEPYGSAMQCDMRASVDANDKISGWSHETYADTFVTRPIIGKDPASRLLSSHFLEKSRPWPVTPPMMVAHLGIHRNMEPLYDIPTPRLVKHRVYDLPLRTSALRTLGGFGNVFAIESMMNELAEACGQDPFEFRLAHLSDARAVDALNQLNRLIDNHKSEFDSDAGIGIGFARYENSAAYCAVAIILKVNHSAEVELQYALCVADVGEVVDGEGVKAQLEGGIIQAASWSLYEQVDYDRDGIISRDWDSYPIITFGNIPKTDIHLIDRPGMPYLGAGEAAAGPTAGAIADAIYDAVGLRVRQMPFNTAAIKAVALQS